MKDVPDIPPRLVRAGKAPGYLGMSRTTFTELVQPHVRPVISIGNVVLYERTDLDAWAARWIGNIYLIQSGAADGPVKIGFTLGPPEQRLALLQVGNPNELRLLGLIRGTVQNERELHKRFRNHHIRGEWFRCDESVLEWFGV